MVRVFDWTVIVGDRSLVSSGKSKGDPKLKKTLGEFLKENKVDAYISGNDNDLEIIEVNFINKIIDQLPPHSGWRFKIYKLRKRI